ncbi:MAG: CBS domain-containing protein [Bryobacterales bacterium]|nr:CBS domain-containing protein [Bryobacterales bacterium]
MAFKDTVRSILETKGRTVWTVGPDETVYRVLALMSEKGVGAVVVVSEGQPLGMFSERDYARKVILHGKSSLDTLVREIMSSPIVTVPPEETVEECMRIMTRNRIRHLPVLESGRLAGVISIGDLVNSIISVQAATIQQLSSYIAGKYPG